MKKAAGFPTLLRLYKGSVVLLSIITVVRALLQVSLAVFMQFVVDAAIANDGSLAFWGVVLLGNIFLMIILYAVQVWHAGSASDRFTAGLQEKLLNSAVYSRDMKLHSYHSGELLSRGMEDAKTVCFGAMESLPSLIGQVTSLVAAFSAVLWINPTVAIVMVVASVVMGALAVWMRPIMKRRQKTVRQTEEQLVSDMQETLQQLELVQSLQIQKPMLRRFGARIIASLKAKYRRRLVSVGSSTTVSAISNLGTGVFLLWGAGQIAAGAMSYGSLTSILQLLSLFRGPVLGISGLWTQLASVEVAADRLLELLEPEEAEKTTENIALPIKAIVFENVTFSYPAEPVPVIQDFSTRFPLDGWACVTGVSGKGKTTLFKLILGLYAPQKGRIYLETENGEIPCTSETRKLFAYVPQDYALFSGTIGNNLRLVKDGAQDEELRRALDIACGDFVWNMTAGLEVPLGENNTGLSKGQIQRLAIARAVLMERPIFLLDECTSALDADTESAVLQQLKQLGKQAILVTHRPEALANQTDIHFVSMET